MDEPVCIFCRIAKKDLPGEVVYEDDATCAFLDITPRAPGHTVVIPRAHHRTLLELPESEVLPVFLAVRRVSRLLVERLNPDGLTIGINQGEASGQTIDHLHIHVIPRYLSDGGGSIHSVVHNPSNLSVTEVGRKLRGT